MAVKLQPQIVEIPYETNNAGRHGKILAAVKQRKKMSYDKMSQRYTAFAENEEKFRAYVKPTKGDSKRADLRKEGRAQFVSVEIPYSFALLMTFHTYMTSVFLSRNPILQYEARHGETQEQVMAVEAVMDYQVVTGEMLIPLYIWLMDMGKYGLGVIGSHWTEESVVTTEAFEEPITYLGMVVPGRTRKGRRTIRIPGYKGNKLFNVRPQDFFPDPRVSIARFQEGEFCGRNVDVGWNTILKRQAEGRYYNVAELKRKIKDKYEGMRDKGSSQLVLPDAMETFYIPHGSNASDAEIKNFISLFELEVELIPKEWELGSSEYPEKWVITVANDEIIVSVEPLGLYHDKFTFDVLEYEIEGYALSKRGMLEVLDPLNQTMSWLFNTHMHNVRRALNDQVIVDPSMIVMKDLMDPGAGRIIRLKPDAYGKDVSTAIKQLTMIDITANHMRDATLVADMMQRVTGVVESVMGMAPSNSRKTATEVRTTSSFSVNRLKTNAEYASAMGFCPLSSKLLRTTQQNYDKEQTFRIAGELYLTKAPMKVTAADIAGAYDFVAIDGTMPVDRYAQAMLWKELLMGAGKIPGAERLDFIAMMKHIAFLSGVKNFSQFEVKVSPDGQVADGVKAGNLVPMGGPGGGTGTGANPGGRGTRSERDLTQVPQSGAVGGLGRAA